MPGIISPVEPRRPMDDNESHRQSLPSIQDIIGSKPPTSAFPPSISTAVSGAPSLPSPFASSTSSRQPFADLTSPQDKHSSPRSLHNPTSFPSRSEPMPPFSDPSRPPLSSRPPPPSVNSYHSAVRPSPPPLKMETHGAEQPREAHRPNSYPHPAVSEATNPPYPQPSHLPPGQLPLSAHPMSPRYSTGTSLPSPFDGSRSMHEDGDYMRRDNKYEQTLNRHFEAWQYQESLAKVSWWKSSPSPSMYAYHLTDRIWFTNNI